jgi:nitrate reductase gamma subunit
MTPKEQLNLLAIFHYVVGGIHALFGSFGLIHVSFGAAILFGLFPKTSHTAAGPEMAMAAIFVIIGGTIVAASWTIGAVTILSGRRIAQRRSRKFSIIVGAINCAILPFGTTLGIFTLILLNRREAELEYGEIPA